MIQTSEETKDLYVDMFGVQKSIAGVVRDSKNPHFGSGYASIAAVINAIKPHLQKAQILFIQAPGETVDGCMHLTTQLVHAPTGQWISYRMSIPLDKKTPQGAGAAITYMCRYSLMAIFGLPPVDDDAEATVTTTEELAEEILQCTTKEELNGWGNDNAQRIQGARGNKAQFKRDYVALMKQLPRVKDVE